MYNWWTKATILVNYYDPRQLQRWYSVQLYGSVNRSGKMGWVERHSKRGRDVQSQFCHPANSKVSYTVHTYCKNHFIRADKYYTFSFRLLILRVVFFRYRRAVFFALLNPQPNGACFAGFRTESVEFDPSKYQAVQVSHFKWFHKKTVFIKFFPR